MCRLFCLLASVAAIGGLVVVGGAPAPSTPAAGTGTATTSPSLFKLPGPGSIKAGKLKPLFASSGKPTPASLALQRLQTLAVNALRDRGYTDVAEVTVGDDQRLGRWGRLAPLSSSSSSMASGGPEDQGSSMVTLDLPTTPLAELANVADLYQSIFGITPDFSNVNDTTSFYQRVQEIILSSAPAISFDCQPSFRVWPKEINFGFPDQHSAVHFFVLPSFAPNDLVMIEGTFPDARYFSFQTYDASLRPISYLRDAHIRPLGNVSNPFTSVPATAQESEGAASSSQPQHGELAQYRLYLTKDGKRGFPNELAATDRRFALAGQVVLLLRLYGIDPRADVSRPDWEPWGYVPPVRVSARILGAVSPTATDLVWKTFPECPANNTLVVRDALTAITNLVNLADTSNRSCQSENVANNFVLYHPPTETRERLTTRTPFANTQDASFLLACANHRHSYRKSSDLIAVVNARLPTTPVGLTEAPYVGDPTAYDVRYASFSVVDLNPPGPVLHTVSDDEFRSAYHKLYGAMKWEAVFGRNVSLMVARNHEVLERCGVDFSDSFVVELEDQTPMSDWFGIVYREVLPQGRIKDEKRKPSQRTAAAASSSLPRSPPSPLPPPHQPVSTRMPYTESIYDAQRVVCASDEKDDDPGECDPNPYRVAIVMKGHFPRVHYYLCSQLGTLTPAPPGRDPFAGKGYPLLHDEVEGAGPWPSVPSYLEFCKNTGRNEGLIRVYGPQEWIHIHYRDPKVPTQQVKVVAPDTVGVLAFPVDASAETVVVGLSVKAKSANEAPFLAEVELCGSVFPADPHWRCFNEPPLDAETWLLPTFDDASWRPAAWAPHGRVDVATAKHAKRHFGKVARFVLPAPALDEEADQAWRTWAKTKDEMNEAWRRWRAAKEGKRNETAADGAPNVTATTEAIQRDQDGTASNTTQQQRQQQQQQQQYATSSMRGGGGGGRANDEGMEDAVAAATLNNSSPHWKDHAPPDRPQRLEWHKPVPASTHGYYCRLAFPNPARAYALEMQGVPGGPRMAGSDA